MMKLKILTITWVALLSLPFVAAATGNHAFVAQKHEQGRENTASMNHPDGMSTDGLMFIVGNDITDGVKGMAHLKDVSEAMAKMGMKTTHHFMIAFVDEATGEQIESGTVTLKITNPDGKVGEAIGLIGMQGHFGADIELDMEGEYHFRLTTKLADGVKRKYHFHHVNK